jgi:hypothetical protein
VECSDGKTFCFGFYLLNLLDALYLSQVLQRLIGGVLAVVLRPREAQSPLIRSIARELVTCLVVQPVMNFASPGYVS